MNIAEYEAYRTETITADEPTVAASEVPGPDRTLVYGYSRAYDAECNESTHTVHVYKRDGLLHVVYYQGRTGDQIFAQSGETLPAALCRPQKRAYPERSDVGFARLMRQRDTSLTFTTFDSLRGGDGPFHGLFIEQTTPPTHGDQTAQERTTS